MQTAIRNLDSSGKIDLSNVLEFFIKFCATYFLSLKIKAQKNKKSPRNNSVIYQKYSVDNFDEITILSSLRKFFKNKDQTVLISLNQLLGYGKTSVSNLDYPVLKYLIRTTKYSILIYN